MLDPLLFPLDSRGQIRKDKKKYGMDHEVGKPSGKGVSITTGKPPPYRQPPLANKVGEARWRQPEQQKEAFLGNERSLKWGLLIPHTTTQLTSNIEMSWLS